MAASPVEGMLAAPEYGSGVAAAGQSVIWLPPDSALLWTWGLLLALGVAVQLLGLLLRRRFFLGGGASLVCCAALLDRDPTLLTGQILLLAGLLWLCGPAAESRSGFLRKLSGPKPRS
ncbi:MULTISPECIES: hypothetical protein [Desulfovibrio]|uniref:Uncharacterized protein n=3 Tax=Desulfovibrio TaxID=872 RepID=A0AA94HTQ1_DESDE|nr:MULTISPECIES: hypothetical protein [Desulfovibrio]ATD81278.1 hypothetical protein CNY67_07685 [Desulfovibrio sp. G11]MDY0204317.1 hypothetical protein [Desulfovibrio desulfuricans]SFW58429.1 hypothetical protein SAMN02910291_01961 [Desulfovibrio desulfuricans]SPD36911.1 Hypothetical protein DSVG11_2882 [Desulfovibrio sp. G11]